MADLRHRIESNGKDFCGVSLPLLSIHTLLLGILPLYTRQLVAILVAHIRFVSTYCPTDMCNLLSKVTVSHRMFLQKAERRKKEKRNFK